MEWTDRREREPDLGAWCFVWIKQRDPLSRRPDGAKLASGWQSGSICRLIEHETDGRRFECENGYYDFVVTHWMKMDPPGGER